MYVLSKFLASGTFTAGIALDWRAQFSVPTFEAPCNTITGVFHIPGVQTTYGVLAYMSLESKNPFDQTLAVLEASVGAPTQVWFNGNLISEVTAPGVVTLPIVRGPNILEVVRSCSPLVIVPSGVLLGEVTTWLSPYAPGADPFSSGTSLSAVDPGFGGAP